jgi:hypothetical protein
MTRRTTLHFVCALLFLAAQWGALTHAVWHLHNPAAAHGQQHASAGAHPKGGEQSPQSKLCDLHSVLGVVLGGDCGAQGVAPLADVSHVLVTVSTAGHAVRFDPTHRSRAPPVLL